ncbi:MAG: YitT family protein [Roseburia sp.]|nr:YitT family protein [Roseburia sp.]MCM1096583.1 YitT family protein [Ruminococcus flavefaciens]
MKKEILVYEGKRSLGTLVGAGLYAAGINLFVVPSGLYTGGLMGICQVIRTLLAELLHLHFESFDIAGIIYYIVNIPIFIVAFSRMGRKFFGKTLLAVTAMTVFMSVIPTTPIVNDAMAACVVGGIISGAGTGIILRMAASGGGMDVVGVLLTKWRNDFSVGKVSLLVNLVLYAACFFLFDVEVVVYSIIYAAVYSVAMDRMHTQNINVEVNVITKADTTALEKEVFQELGRGITKWSALGAYTYDRSHVLYIMLSKYEVNHLKSIIHKYDPHAFIVVNEGVSVDGNYLKKLG